MATRGPGMTFSSSFEWNGPKLVGLVGVGAARGINRALEYLRSRSVPLAPLDRGPLRESATVRQASPEKLEGFVIYDTPYAVRQHEELEYHHDDGQAKYLEEPLNDHRAEMQAIIAAEVASVLRS